MTEYCATCHGFRPFTTNGIGMYICVSCKQDITPETKDTMITEEMRELDAWIAEHVMGWHISRYGQGSYIHNHWQPTESPSDAMAVLERCAEKCPVAIDKNRTGWTVCRIDHLTATQLTHGDTIPLAICLFARKVFSAS